MINLSEEQRKTTDNEEDIMNSLKKTDLYLAKNIEDYLDYKKSNKTNKTHSNNKIQVLIPNITGWQANTGFVIFDETGNINWEKYTFLNNRDDKFKGFMIINYFLNYDEHFPSTKISEHSTESIIKNISNPFPTLNYLVDQLNKK